ncbi:hypothetical protein H4W29_004884 [Rhizobium viscosum]|uniref:Uncharacterized protein n=1 Tax=Rhizobium viscosum TaxID=1673 RepID=A0ABR9IWQ6_RHIVS|nr:hypothetical protein [Rhizobium viscosum]
MDQCLDRCGVQRGDNLGENGSPCEALIRADQRPLTKSFGNRRQCKTLAFAEQDFFREPDSRKEDHCAGPFASCGMKKDLEEASKNWSAISFTLIQMTLMKPPI